MLFGKKNHLVGLDIGSQSIKLAEVADTKKGLILKKFACIDLPNGAIEDGVIIEPETVASSIYELFKTNQIKETNVAISIGGNAGIVKKIAVKTMAEDELQKNIHFEAEQYIPFDISEVNLDFQIIGPSDQNPNQMSVLLAAAKKDIIDKYVEVLTLADLTPCVIDVDAFSIQNIYDLNYESKEDHVALIDVGASKMSLNIIKDGVSIFMRDVSLGCAQINREIISLTGCSDGEAESAKTKAGEAKVSQQDLDQVMTSAVTDWCTEIGRAFDFFYSSYPGDRIKNIIVSGGGANIKSFRQFLADQTGTEVTVLNPFNALTIDTNEFDIDYLTRMAPQAAISLGLAIRRVDDK